MSSVKPCIFRFGDFCLDPVGREIRHGDTRLELPRLPFDGLVFLVSQRGRAVSRDELIDAVWDTPNVEDIQVTQLIMRLRRMLGDDSSQPRFIRTVPGFGYRWVAETEATPVDDTASPSAESSITTSRRLSRPYRVGIAGAVVLGLVLIALTLVRYGSRDGSSDLPLPRAPGDAVVVLPLNVDFSPDSDAGWLRLGAMDLIAERLRTAGLPVPSSESVISALHAAERGPEAERRRILRSALGAGVVVEGKLVRVSEGWTIELIATSEHGDRWRTRTEAAEAIPAADRAAGLLLAALGREPGPPVGDDEASLSELLQRARAALLALELDTARAILEQAPAELQQDPEVRFQLALTEHRAGNLDRVMALTDELLDDPAVLDRPRLHARILNNRGYVTSFQEENVAAGESYYDAAVRRLENDPWSAELGMALAMRGLARTFAGDFEQATHDLGHSRIVHQVVGNRGGVARVHEYHGYLALERQQPQVAQAHFLEALAIDEAIGNVAGLHGTLISIMNTQMQLLQWPEAVATGERLQRLRERTPSIARRAEIHIHHAGVLMARGRLSEAAALLDEVEWNDPNMPQYAKRGFLTAMAELAWRQNLPEQALEASELALEIELAARMPDIVRQQARLALLHQRASIAIGRAMPATAVSQRAGPIKDSPVFLVAQAEWAAYRERHDEAARLFRQARMVAEAMAVPDLMVTVAGAHARWLLGRGRVTEAVAVAGTVAGWADRDYDAALMQVMVLAASGQDDAWLAALHTAGDLAGERQIPSEFRPHED